MLSLWPSQISAPAATPATAKESSLVWFWGEAEKEERDKTWESHTSNPCTVKVRVTRRPLEQEVSFVKRLFVV